jgi:D-alanine transaminase
MRLADERGLTVEERSFTIDEAKSAAEVFCTSASTFVTPVISIDGETIGSGHPGTLTKELRRLYISIARQT